MDYYPCYPFLSGPLIPLVLYRMSGPISICQIYLFRAKLFKVQELEVLA